MPDSAPAAASTLEDAPVDPYDAAVGRDPDGYFRSLRREHPVCPIAGGAMLLVSRHRDVATVLRDSVTYSNRSSLALADLARAGFTPTDPDVLRTLAEAPTHHDTLIKCDAPDHTRQRKVVSRWFTPRRVNVEWMPIIEQVAAQLFDDPGTRGTFDVMAALAVPLPINVIATLLGVSPGRRHDFKRWSDAFVASIGRRLSRDEWMQKIEAQREMSDFFLHEIQDRQLRPRDDLLTLMASVATTDDVEQARRNDVLTVHEALDMVEQLLVAGNETTTQLLAVIVEQFVAHPDLLERVRQDPDAAPRVVEEALRIASPVRGLFRYTAERSSLSGTEIPPGRLLAVLYASANRDEEVFEDPGAFSIDRPNLDQHLAFGSGPHFCLGAALARAEALVFVRQLTARFDRIEPGPSGDHDDDGSFLLRGRRRLVVQATLRDGAV